MVANPQSVPTTGTTVLLFGPQVLTFNQQSFEKLRSALSSSPSHSWILKAVSELPAFWKTISKAFPQLSVVAGEQLLGDLQRWLDDEDFSKNDFRLPNVLLTPLVVITQLTQYSRYLALRLGKQSPSQDLQAAFAQQSVKTVGFCTGLLAACAVSSSSNQQEFEKYGSVAIRLAVLVGALVDAQEATDKLHGHAKSYACAWTNKDQAAELTRIIDHFPEAYLSVQYDEKRATITTAERTAPLLIQQLKTAGVLASEVGLRGRFHCKTYSQDIEPVLQLIDSEPTLQFPAATALPIEIQTFALDGTLSAGGLHHLALRAILVEQSLWYQTFSRVQSAYLQDKDSIVVSIGPDRCVPPSLMRSLGPRLIHVADSDADAPQLSASVMDSDAYSRFAGRSDNDDIAVVGMSIKVAGADDLEEFAEILRAGKSQHEEVPESRFGFETQWREKDEKRKWYGNFMRDVDAFDHKFFKKSPRESASQDPQHRLMLQAAYQAVEQSGYFSMPNADKHIGTYIGACAADYEHNVACYPPNAFTATGNLKSFIPGRIAHYFGWTGPGMTIDTACSASAVAIHLAARAILNGECTGAIAGGVATMENPLWFQNLAGATFLSPTGQCKPFDEAADGYCRGEGIACVFLKKMSAAIADGNQIFGVVSSTMVYQNENCTPLFVPNSPSLSHLFKDVIKRARLQPEQISLVEAHGTGTPVGDPAEYESVRLALGGPIRPKPLPLGSVKGLIGHTEGVSGVISLIKVLVLMQEGFIPAQASHSKLSHHIKASPEDHMYVPTKLADWDETFKAALINNYGASGSNASMVVTQSVFAGQDPAPIQKSNARHPFWIPGFDNRSLTEYTTKLLKYIKNATISVSTKTLANLSFNLARQTNHTFNNGLVFSAASVSDLEEKLQGFVSKLPAETAIKTSRPVILCFGGQISTFVGLDREIYESVKLLRSYLDQCDTAFKSIGLDGIYPEIFQRSTVEDTVKLQSMLFAIQYASAKCWIDSGASVAAVVGHSFGELTALCVSGALSLIDTARLVAGRAKVVRDSWGADKGSMIAVEGDIDLVNNLVATANKVYAGDRPACVACYNGTRSFTLAGSFASIDAVVEVIGSHATFKGMKNKRLNVSNAFHSTLVEPLLGDLEEVGVQLNFKTPSIPFERATENKYTDKLSAKFVADHMRSPVYFNHAIQRLVTQYPESILLEAGSQSTITIMANRALGNLPGVHFQAMNITSDNALQSLTDATVNLWKEGLRVQFWAHHATQTYDFGTLMLPPYQFEKARHWMELKKPVQAVALPAPAVAAPVEIPKGLYTFVGHQDDAKRVARFRVNTMTEEYNDYVSGHLIANTAAICPATLICDLAIEAIASMTPEFTAHGMQAQIMNLQNYVPICVDPSRAVWLDYETIDEFIWSWKMVSVGADGKGNTTHVDGKLQFVARDDAKVQHQFSLYERLVKHARCTDVLNNDEEADDIIQGRNIYKTFGGVVDYAEKYRGVKKLVGRGNESAGRVNKKHAEKTWFDVLLSDCFSQVAGIWVNCMTDCSASEMFIATGCEHCMRNPNVGPDYKRPEVWDIFACHQQKSDKLYLTDLFVFDPSNGQLIEVMLGINYAKVPKASMSRILTRLTAPDALPAQASAAAKIDLPAVATLPTLAPAAAFPLAESPKAAADGKPKKEKKAGRPDISGDVKNIIATVSGLEPDEIKPNSELADFGIDSLMGMELAREVESFFKCSLDQDELMEATTFAKFVKCIEGALFGADAGTAESEEDNASDTGSDAWSKVDGGAMTPFSEAAPGTPPNEKVVEKTNASNLAIPRDDLLEAWGNAKVQTDKMIGEFKIDNFVSTVLPKTTQLCVVLICDAFEKLGVNLRNISAGQTVPKIKYEPQHERLVSYLYNLLEKDARLIDIKGSEMVRTAIPPPAKGAESLLAELLKSFPEWAYASKLTNYAGKNLADVLTGKTDGIRVIFGTAEARELVSGLYCEHAFNKMSYNQMAVFLADLISRLDLSQGPLKILEMGAGTGGTTLVLAPFLQKLGIPVIYTYTDLSPSMVAQAKRKFKQYDFMQYAVHDIEKPPAPELLDQHIVVASNAVHATHSLTRSGENIRKTLRPDGFLMMLEMTAIVPFVDLIFGLLEGWWLFDDDRTHACVPPTFWEQELQKVGFGHCDWSDGHLAENEIQKVIIAHASGPPAVRRALPPKTTAGLPDAARSDAVRDAEVNRYVEKYTQGFAGPGGTARTSPAPQAHVVLVTGATGSLGSHLVAQLARDPGVATVVCVNRRSSTEAQQRMLNALSSRGIVLAPAELAKLRVLETDTAKPLLGLPAAEHAWLAANVTHMLHNAWPMSGTRPLKAFEPQFQTLRNLIDLAVAAQAQRPTTSRVGFELVSSIGVVGQYPFWSGKTYVPEERMEMRSVLPIGYCEAKLVCERMLERTLHEFPESFRAMTTRPGQIAGSRESGYWNPVEHLSFLFKSAYNLRVLPDFDGVLQWVPVNDVAGTCVDVLMAENEPHPIYHVDNPVGQPWKDMIRVLADAMGIDPQQGIVPFAEWIRRVKVSPLNMDTDNPAARLIGFLDDHFVRMSCGGLILDTTKVREHSPTLASQGPVSPEVARKYIQGWKDMGFFHG